MKILNKQNGFTLIEVLIVVALIGIMITGLIILIDPAAQLARGRDSQRKGDLRTYQQALELYRADNNVYPSHTGAASDLTLSAGGVVYLRTPPVAPKGGTCNYLYVSNGSIYTIYTILENTKDPDAKISFSGAGVCSGAYNYSVLSP